MASVANQGTTFSTETEASDGNNTGLKIVCPVIGVILTTSATYVMISLVAHYVKSIKQARRLREEQRKQMGSVRSRKQPSRGAKKLSAWLGYLSLASAVFAFLNCISDHALLYLQDTTDETCKIMQSFTFVFFPCGIISVYSFLWVRQRVFYSSPTLGRLHSKLLRWTSFAVLPIFIILILIGVITTLTIFDYRTSAVGCIEVSGSKVPKIFIFVGALVMQTTLLALFIYPLKEHTGSEESTLPENKLLLSLIERACATTGLCVLADTIAFTIVMVLPSDGPCVVVNLIRDGNLVVNVICIVCSFVDWKDRLGSLCRESKVEYAKPGEIRLIRSSINRDSKNSPSNSQVSPNITTKQSVPAVQNTDVQNNGNEL